MNEKEITITVTFTEREILLIREAIAIILKKIAVFNQCELTDPKLRGEGY